MVVLAGSLANEMLDGQAIDDANYDEALREMNAEVPDIRRAFELLHQAQSAGDPRAVYALGTWYLYGKPPVIERDLTRAVELLKQAAAAGLPDALYDLAVSYEKGETGTPDPVNAFQSYLRAAIRGDDQSVYEVGRCYQHGIGVRSDPSVAAIWFDRAKELGVS
jgi:TPR repeat protein